MIPFNNKPESSSDSTFLIRSSLSLFDIISVILLPDPNIFLWIPASAADAAAVSSKGINTLLANGVITLLNHFHFQRLIQKVCLLLENLD